MKKHRFLVSLFLLSVSQAFAGEYADTSGGFSYNVPSDWILKAVGNNRFKVAFSGEGVAANIGIIINDCKGNVGFCAVTQLNDMAKGYAKSGFTNFHVIDTHAFENAHNQVGVEAITECKRIDGKALRQIFYFFERKDGIKLIVTCSAVDLEDNYDAEFEAIVKTFKVNL